MIQKRAYIYQPLIEMKAPILPGVGLGGVKLDQSLHSLKDWLLYNFTSENMEQVTATAFHGVFISYSIGGKVDIVIDVVEGRIETIGCSTGYEGSYDGLKPGITLYELLKVRKDTYIKDGYIYLMDTPGIKIDYPESYEDYEYIHEFPDFVIERIYVTR